MFRRAGATHQGCTPCPQNQTPTPSQSTALQHTGCRTSPCPPACGTALHDIDGACGTSGLLSPQHLAIATPVSSCRTARMPSTCRTYCPPTCYPSRPARRPTCKQSQARKLPTNTQKVSCLLSMAKLASNSLVGTVISATAPARHARFTLFAAACWHPPCSLVHHRIHVKPRTHPPPLPPTVTVSPALSTCRTS